MKYYRKKTNEEMEQIDSTLLLKTWWEKLPEHVSERELSNNFEHRTQTNWAVARSWYKECNEDSDEAFELSRNDAEEATRDMFPDTTDIHKQQEKHRSEEKRQIQFLVSDLGSHIMTNDRMSREVPQRKYYRKKTNEEMEKIDHNVSFAGYWENLPEQVSEAELQHGYENQTATKWAIESEWYEEIKERARQTATKSYGTAKEYQEHFNKIFNPPHYTEDRKYEPIAIIEDWKLNYHLGNVLKYISRAGRKENEIEDLKKARWYLDRYIKKIGG